MKAEYDVSSMRNNDEGVDLYSNNSVFSWRRNRTAKNVSYSGSVDGEEVQLQNNNSCGA
jgi:hypothetical protein